MRKYAICMAILLLVLSFGQVEAQEPPRASLLVTLSPNALYPHPCPATIATVLKIRNNTLSPIIVDWNSEWEEYDLQCATDYSPKSGTGVSIAAQQTETIDITISLDVSQCKDDSKIRFTGWIQTDTNDRSYGVVGIYCRDRPTLCQWVLMVLAVSVGGLFVWQLKRRRQAAASV